MTSSATAKARILVVDDTPQNLKVFRAVLAEALQYRPRQAEMS